MGELSGGLAPVVPCCTFLQESLTTWKPQMQTMRMWGGSNNNNNNNKEEEEGKESKKKNKKNSKKTRGCSCSSKRKKWTIVLSHQVEATKRFYAGATNTLRTHPQFSPEKSMQRCNRFIFLFGSCTQQGFV